MSTFRNTAVFQCDLNQNDFFLATWHNCIKVQLVEYMNVARKVVKKKTVYGDCFNLIFKYIKKNNWIALKLHNIQTEKNKWNKTHEWTQIH